MTDLYGTVRRNDQAMVAAVAALPTGLGPAIGTDPLTPFLPLRDLIERPELISPPAERLPRIAWQARSVSKEGGGWITK